MKFSSLLQDTAAIDVFIKILSAASRLSKKRCCVKIEKEGLNFISISGLHDGGAWFNLCVPYSSQLFRKFDMVGMNPRNPEQNFIFFELEIDSLVRILPGGHCYLKLKLSKSQSDEPILSVEVRNPEADIVSHQIPITIVLSKYWNTYARPTIKLRKMCISMPPPKAIARFIHAFRNMNARVVKFTASVSGDLRISTKIDHGEIDASFSDLQTSPSETDSQEETANVQLMIRNIQSLFQSFAHTRSRVKMNIISNRMAEFNIHNEDCVLSFIVGNVSD
ncbi:hypothetical protein L5515_001354 [Caenorhabditis briggsae]|uniref:Checkpoint protein n=1 Tax=Caenorhabditis briggsae TaxID=6238 RepID=A0AAE9E4D4_CAEBR|nr:hypothetical protein L5515_001354 [Caenorhabditis briggsae]